MSNGENNPVKKTRKSKITPVVRTAKIVAKKLTTDEIRELVSLLNIFLTLSKEK